MTITSGHKTSLLVASQLPQYIRDDPTYATFVAFLEAYYQWTELTGNITESSKNLLSYADVDQTIPQFLDYFVNDFLPYFPQDALVSKEKAIKFARQLYQTKGTPASYQFLFRILYNSDCDIYNTEDLVLKASDGVWYVPQSLNLLTTDPNWLNIQNLRIFGLTSKSIATVETSVLDGTKTEVFISNIERLFKSGEFVTLVDNNNQQILFNGAPITAKIVGQVGQININPTNRGLLYQPGNPIIIYGGLSSSNGIGATATVGQTTTGSIQRIDVTNGGFGYQLPPNSAINITNGGGAAAAVSFINPAAATQANVTLVPSNIISLKRFVTLGNSNYGFSNIAISNANTTLINAFSFDAFTTYPISTVALLNGGGGLTTLPTVSAASLYPIELSANTGLYGNLGTLGILAPIQITNAGSGYRANDIITFTGGAGGVGANAIVTSVNGTGAILTTQYVPFAANVTYPLGGLGYNPVSLPTLNIVSANNQASNASLYVPTTLGNGAQFSLVVNRIGAITSINITDYGQDYVSTPNVSLIVQDIAVSNVSLFDLPQPQTLVYQGANTSTATYTAFVSVISLIGPNANPANSVYNLRVYNYTGSINPALPLSSNTDSNISLNVVANYSNYGANGAITYGDGTAKATATFLNGLTIGQGSYITNQGQPSSYSVLQSNEYNNYTYQIVVEKEIAKYRDILLNLLHPSGMQIIGVYAIKSNNEIDLDLSVANNYGYFLPHYSNTYSSNAIMSTNFSVYSTNIITFQNLNGANVGNIAPVNSTITITPASGYGVFGKVVSVNVSANSVTIDNNVWLTFANVANISVANGTNTININSLTNSYNIVNNGHYSNTQYPLMDIVYAGDLVNIANNPIQTVTGVNYINGIIYVQNNWTANATSYLSVNRNYTITGNSVLISE